MQRLLLDAHVLADRWWDPERELLTTPAGRFDDHVVVSGQHGVLPPTLWYAYGLLRRDAAGDRERAEAAIASVVRRQYSVPGAAWDGTWPAVAEEGEPGDDAEPYRDYDPNWRVFVGCALALILRDHDLPEALASEVLAAVVRAVRCEPEDRVRPRWTNVAAQLAWLEVEVGAWEQDEELARRGMRRAERIVLDAATHGHVAEHGSPTYTGITLFGLSLWTERPPLEEIAELGAALRDEVWNDLLSAWHPGLGTLVPPLSRAYGMDMREHVGATAPWLTWLVDGAWPFPPLGEGVLHQGHDLMLAFVVDALAGAGDEVRELAPALRAQPARQGAWTDAVGPRRWSGWTGPGLAVGAETSRVDWRGWWQAVSAAAIWRAPDDHNAWLRLHVDSGAVDAHVRVAGGEVHLQHAVGDEPVRLLTGGGMPERLSRSELVLGARRWSIHGVATIRSAPPRSSPDTMTEVELRPDPGVAHIVLSTPIE